MFVTACHRSGSSLLSALLHDLLHGSHQGGGFEKHLQPSHDNYQGVFESQKLVRVNEELLTMLDMKWDVPLFPLPRNTKSVILAKAVSFRDLFFEEIRSSHWVDKDPRLCITGPIFEHILLKRVPYCIVLRHPAEVASSLYRRNGFEVAKGYYLWFAYNYSLATYLQSTDMMISYDLLLDDVVATRMLLTRAAQILKIEQNNSLSLDNIIRERVNSSLKRNTPSNNLAKHSEPLENLADVAHDIYCQMSSKLSSGESYEPVNEGAVNLFKELFQDIPVELINAASSLLHSYSGKVSQGNINNDVKNIRVSGYISPHDLTSEEPKKINPLIRLDNINNEHGDVSAKLQSIQQLKRVKSIIIPSHFIDKLDYLVLLSHYHADGVLQKILRRKIDSLLNFGWQILLITPCINDESLEFCKSRGLSVFIRKNEGKDFGAYQDAMIWLYRHDYHLRLSQMLLINDSCALIPNLDQSSWFDFVGSLAKPGSIEGLTDSYQISFHLQSYCLKVAADILRSNWWIDFWKELKVWGEKLQIIIYGEVELSRQALLNNVTLIAKHPCHQVRASICSNSYGEKVAAHFGIDIKAAELIVHTLLQQMNLPITTVNPAHHLAIPLLVDGFPLIKRDLMEKNPFGFIDPLFVVGHLFSADELAEFLKPLDGRS